MLLSVLKENFFTDDELDFITQTIYDFNQNYTNYENDKLFADYYTFGYYSKEFGEIKNLFDKKFSEVTDKKIIIDHSHIFHSKRPYTVHTDYFQRRLYKNLIPAYTIIIPLENYNSHTLVFNQHSEIKSMDEFILKEHPPELKNHVTDEDYKKYLTHCLYDIMKYLSIKEIFPWRKGSIHMCDRRYFHASDNYLANGIKVKRAIVMWTSLTS